ncbi:hypothetical protein [Petrimonas sulfuriphila]|uniref:hypothetical protein n=1 Tax=Petrimonas sulfuriphila TaxID=285070 RepID=UPI003EBF9F17
MKKPIQNLVFAYGRWMTESDKLAITALNVARNVTDKNNIIPVRQDKKIIGFEVHTGKSTILINNDLFS